MKRLTRALLTAMLLAALGLCGCSTGSAGLQQPAEMDGAGSTSEADADAAAQADELRIGSMKGPTSVGLASMMQQGQGQFTVVAAADELTALLLQDELDIALVPANVAALLFQRTEGQVQAIDVNTLGVLYGVSLDGSVASVGDLRGRTVYMTGKGTLFQRTEGQVQAIDVNTLGVLYGVSLDGSVASVGDLRGRTVYMTGKGTVPEYTFLALLEAAGMGAGDVTVQFCAEPAEVAAQVAQHDDAVGILPQPYATAVTVQNPDVREVLDLTEQWAELTGGERGDLVTGVTVAKTSTVQDHRDAIDTFLARHGESAAAANADPASIAATVAELGIIDSVTLAEKAIPRCNVVCLVGEPMRQALSGYLESLYQQSPEAVGLGIIDSVTLAEKAIPRCNVVCLVGEPMRQALSGYLESLYQQSPEAVGGVLPDASFYYAAQ